MQKLRILVAEDDPLTLRLLENLLIDWGYDVITAVNGEHARQILKAGGIRICILDWVLPELTGRDLCAWVYASELKPMPYVILLTAKGKPQQICDGFAAGAHDYITKPFESDDLRFRVAELALRVMKADAVGEEVSKAEPIDMYRLDLKKYRKALSRPV